MEHMSLIDASFLHLEDDSTPMHIGGVAVFEGPPPTREELTARFAAKIPMVPRYRQRVRFLPLDLGRPAWIDDRHFSLDYHLRRSAVPAPGGRAELDALVSRVMSQHLDRARPLWEVWVVEGLEDGRWAIVSKVHHCMVDGVASVDLMALLFDAERDAGTPDAPPPWNPRPEPGAREVATASLAGLVSPVEGARRAVGALRSPRALLTDGVETVRAVAGVARTLVPPAPTSLNGAYGPHRRWTAVHATLAEVKAVRAALGGTVNDVVLTAITRGFRDLLLGRGEPVEGRVVRTMVPVSTRAEGVRGANHVSSVFVDLPVGLADPLARLAAVRAAMDGVKRSKGAVAGARLVELSGFAPPVLLAAAQRFATTVPQTSFHTVTTNVPGPQRPLYFAGRRMLESAPTIPLGASIRTAVGIFSYDGSLHFGLTGDYDTVPDLAVLARGIEAGVAELVDLAGPRAADPPGARPDGETGDGTGGARSRVRGGSAGRAPRSTPRARGAAGKERP
jgi:diacylglycerol O-acyltransferase / wax synthase